MLNNNTQNLPKKIDNIISKPNKNFLTNNIINKNNSPELIITKVKEPEKESNENMQKFSNKKIKINVEENYDKKNTKAKNLVNILNESCNKKDDFFSVTITEVSEPSEEQLTLEFKNKENKLEIITNNKFKRINSLKCEYIIEENEDFKDNSINKTISLESDNLNLDFLENYNLPYADFNEKGNLSKLATLNLNPEELKKIESFFISKYK